MTTLITGVAGFIGYHMAEALLSKGEKVVGVDNLNDYYEVALKRARLSRIGANPLFDFRKIDISDRFLVRELFNTLKPATVVHLAAQAGVRYSLTNPHAYIESNINGFLNILEGCKKSEVQHLIYASSSSVYGGNTVLPFSEDDRVEKPLSLYGATKISNELMARVYSDLYNIPTTGLRFFTVYGPWGRPDMSLFRFTKNIIANEPIDVFNDGNHKRDFTYIDDIINGLVATSNLVPSRPPDEPDKSISPPYQIFNIGNGRPVELTEMIKILENALGRKAKLNFMPRQPGDVHDTHANIELLEKVTGYRPKTDLETGVSRFLAWYKEFYRIS